LEWREVVDAGAARRALVEHLGMSELDSVNANGGGKRAAM
jgi:hypothetical protein